VVFCISPEPKLLYRKGHVLSWSFTCWFVWVWENLVFWCGVGGNI
jgi:hypothetical protein